MQQIRGKQWNVQYFLLILYILVSSVFAYIRTSYIEAVYYRVENSVMYSIFLPVSVIVPLGLLFGKYIYLCVKIGCMIDDLEIERLVKLELKKSDLTHKTEKQVNSYKEELYLMANLMNEDSNESCFEPKVGIFWFNSNDKQLLDVVTEDLQTALAKFPKSNEVTCSKLHKDVWKKELMKALAKKDSASVEIHSKNYMDKIL